MPKMKSHSGAKKRFKVTAKGKVMAKRAMGQHILTKKSRKNKRGKKNLYALNNTDAKLIKILIT